MGILDPKPPTRAELSATYAPVSGSANYEKPTTKNALASRAAAGTTPRLPAAALSGASTSTPTYTDLIGLLKDGSRKVFTNSGFSASQIGVSTDGVSFTWGKNLAGGNGIAGSIVETPGGEVLVSVKHRDNLPGKVWRSTGWNPATADATSWAAVLTASGTAVHFDGRWCLTQRSVAPRWSARAGAIFAAEYGNHISEAATPAEAAIRVYMSTDDGVTWSTIFDLRNYNTDTNAHIHAAAYDPWDDRVIVTVGDNANAAVYYCNGEDLASPVWSSIAGTTSGSMQSTTVIPMASGLVLLPDSANSIIRRVPRLGYRGYAAIETLLTIATGGTAVIGAHAYQSDALGPLLLTVYSSTTSGPPAIYATLDGKTVTAVYTESSSVTTGTGITSVVGPDINGRVWATKNMGGSGVLFQANYVQSGVAAPSGGVTTSRAINAGPGISGGGDLSADRTLTIASSSAAGRRGLLGHAGPEELFDANSVALTDGTLYLVKVIAEDSAASGARTVRVWQEAAASGLTSWTAAVFDSTGVQLGTTSASDAGSATSHRNFSVGSFALTKGQEYYLGVLFKGTTGPTLARSAANARVRAGLTGAALLYSIGGTALAAMPSSITPATNANLDIALWAAIL